MDVSHFQIDWREISLRWTLRLYIWQSWCVGVFSGRLRVQTTSMENKRTKYLVPSKEIWWFFNNSDTMVTPSVKLQPHENSPLPVYRYILPLLPASNMARPKSMQPPFLNHILKVPEPLQLPWKLKKKMTDESEVAYSNPQTYGYFQNVILFSNIVPFDSNTSVWNYSNGYLVSTVNTDGLKPTRPSVATVLITHHLFMG